MNIVRHSCSRRNLYFKTLFFISHDLSVVKFQSDTMAVMRADKIVEAGIADEIYANPVEEYTRRLIDAVPRDDLDHIQVRLDQRAAAREQRNG